MQSLACAPDMVAFSGLNPSGLEMCTSDTEVEFGGSTFLKIKTPAEHDDNPVLSSWF